jgi:hypothetical protein
MENDRAKLGRKERWADMIGEKKDQKVAALFSSHHSKTFLNKKGILESGLQKKF